MRTPERIPLFLSRVRVKDIVLKLWNTTEDQEDAEYKIDVDSIEQFVHSKEFKDYWLSAPDLRFGQAMVNKGYNIFDAIYHKEESEILNSYCGYSRPESYLWGSNFNEDGSLRGNTLWRFVDQLDDSHLDKMVDGYNAGMFAYMERMAPIFVEELHRRGFVNYKIHKP
jgi:hypothetical protein